MSDWDARTTHDAVEGPQWVSAAEAADVAGVTPGTVRYWARNGLIVSEVVEGPAGEKTLVRLDEVLRHARQESGSGPAGAKRTSGGDPADVVTDLPARTSELAPILKSIPEIMAQLTAATDRAARAETKVEFLSAQLNDMRRRLAEAEAGRASLPGSGIPEAWETTSRPETGPGDGSASPAETAAGDDPPGSGGWPAPPAADVAGGLDWGAATADPPAAAPEWPAQEASEPGPESIDWGAGDSDAGPALAEPAPAPRAEEPEAAPGPSAEEPETATETRLSLEELWASPSRTDPPPAPAPPVDRVDWNDPVGTGTAEAEEPVAPPPPRRANATLPDDEFYGPRRRRWFRRKP